MRASRFELLGYNFFCVCVYLLVRASGIELDSLCLETKVRSSSQLALSLADVSIVMESSLSQTSHRAHHKSV